MSISSALGCGGARFTPVQGSAAELSDCRKLPKLRGCCLAARAGPPYGRVDVTWFGMRGKAVKEDERDGW